MKNFLSFLALFISLLNLAQADTPAPGIVKLKGATDSTLIGNVSDSLKVDVTNDLSITFPDFLPVSQSGTWSVGRTWSLLDSTDSVSSYQGGLWDISVMNFPSSFIANIGTTGGLALDSTLSSFSSKFGTLGQHNSAGSASVVIASDQTVPISGTISVANFPATQPISGTVTANAGTGTFEVGQSTGTNLHTNVDNFPSSQNVVVTNTPTVISTQSTGSNLHVVVDTAPSTPVTQATTPWVTSGSVTVSGTITANQGTPGPIASPWPMVLVSPLPLPVSVSTLPLPTGAATSANQTTANSSLATIATNTTTTATNTTNIAANQTNATQKTQIVDGSGNVVGPLTIINSVNRLPVISSGRGVLSTFTQSYSSSNLSISAFTTIISTTTSTVNEEDIFDNSGGIWYLAYASTCGALSSSTNAIIIGPGGGSKDFQIPSGNCVGFQALGTAITTGSVYMTFYK